jgi:hypothetical protein
MHFGVFRAILLQTQRFGCRKALFHLRASCLINSQLLKTTVMKEIFMFVFVNLALTAFGQDKHSYIQFDKLTEVVGTEYVVAAVENSGKMLDSNKNFLLFINTKTGESNRVDLPAGAGSAKLEQIKIDSLRINLFVVTGRNVDLNGKNGIDWEDPVQIVILTPDGKSKTQLTDNNFFVRTLTVNKSTGTLVVTGHYDSNNNNKYDKTDQSEIRLYDLKTQKLVNRVKSESMQ